MTSGLETHSATIERPTYTADAYGGHVATFATVYSGVPGSLQPAKGRTIDEFARRSEQVSHTFYTDTPVATLAGDRLVVSSVNYLILADADMAGRGSHFAIHCLKKD